jgi:hypothetical protein
VCFYIVAGTQNGIKQNISLDDTPTPPRKPLPDTILEIISGDNQSEVRDGGTYGGKARHRQLQVKLKDASSRPMPNELVDLSPGSHPGHMAVQVDPRGATPAAVLTDAEGIATLNKL